MPFLSKNFAENVRKEAWARGMTVKDLLRASGVDQRTFYNWIAGRFRPSYTVAKLIADELCMTVEELDGYGYQESESRDR